jgi:Cu2+-exporting ATPase
VIADRIARPFLIGVLIAAACAAFILWPVDHGRALMAAVAVLIVTCPCALSLATPAAMLTISGALAQKGVLVRKMQALEALSQIDTVIFDKTGTLSQDQQTISAIQTHEQYTPKQALNIAAQLANFSLHPLSKAIVKTAGLHEESAEIDIKDVKEVPGAGIMANSSIGTLKLGSSAFCGLEILDRMAASSVHLVSEHGWIASFMFEESMKADVGASVQALNQQGINVQLLSGDNQEAVDNFARKAGITLARGGCSPQDKLHHMQTLQQQGRQVAMIGDGLNDGPILALANVSIAMGQAVPLAQAQSDFVVMNNEVPMIVVLLNQAKRTMRIVKQNLMWAVVYNIVCVPLAVMGWLPAWLAGLGMALSSLLVVGNALRLSAITSLVFTGKQ